MQKILIATVGSLVLLGGLVMVVPGMIDWNAWKPEITRQIEALSGRKLTIDGNVEITLLPVPALIVNDAGFANAPDASHPQMMRLKHLEVRLVPLPLLGGDIQVQKIKLVDPVVRLEVLNDGRANWEITSPPVSTGASIDLVPEGQPLDDENPARNSGETPDESLNDGPRIQVDNVEVVNATIIYEDSAAGVHEQISQLNATFKAGSLQGPFKSTGSLIFRDTPVSYEITTDGIFQGRTVPVSALVRTEAADARLQLNGNVLNFDESPRFKGTIAARGTSLAALAFAMTGIDTLPGAANQAFELGSDIDASAASLDLPALVMQLGETTVQGTLSAEIGPVIETSSAFTVKHVNVDSLMDLEPFQPPEGEGEQPDSQAGVQGGVQPSGEPESQSGAVALRPAPLIPGDIVATTSLVIDALTLRGEKAGPVRLNAALANGEITISQLSAQFPGATDVALFGFAGEQDGGLVFEGESDIAVGDTRRLARWLGVDTFRVPGGRLRHVSLSSNIRATPDQVQISGIKAAFDNSTLSGGITLALRKRLSFGASLSLDRIDLDGYLPPQPAVAGAAAGSATGANNGASVPAAEQVQEQATGGADILLPLSLLKALTTFDASVRLRIDELVHNDQTLKGMAMDGTLVNGDLSLENASIDDLAGVSTALSGQLNDLGGNPKFRDFNLRLDAKSIARILDMLESTSPLWPEAVGAVAMDATLNGALLQPSITGTLTGFDARLTVDGRLSALPFRPVIDARVTLDHANTANLLKAIDSAYRPAGDIGGLAFSSRVQGGADGFDLSDMEITQGEAAARGSASITMAQERPELEANILFHNLPVDPFLPAETGQQTQASNTQNSSNNNNSTDSADAPSGAPWSREPLDLGALKELDADIEVQATALNYDAIDMKNVTASATLLDGVLTVENLSGAVAGGNLHMSGVVNAQAVPSMEGTIDLSGADLGSLLQAFDGETPATGTMALDGNFAAVGNSVHDLVSGLNGTGSFAITGLDVNDDLGKSPLAGIMGLTRMIGQAGSESGKQGSGEQGADGLADVNGAFTVTRGVAQLDDFALTSGLGSGAATGFVDLGQWNMDMAGELKLSRNPLTELLAKATGTPDLVPFSIRGALDDPAVHIETGSVQDSGDGSLSSPDPVPPPKPRKITPEVILDQLFDL